MKITVGRIGSHQGFDMVAVSESWACLEVPIGLIREFQQRFLPSLSQANSFSQPFCFLDFKNALSLSFSKLICSFCLFACSLTSWFKVLAISDRAWVWERTIFLFWWFFTTSSFLGFDSCTGLSGTSVFVSLSVSSASSSKMFSHH